jgi:hypothetical protein
MIPLTKYLIVKSIASLSHGEVEKPRPDDYQLKVTFTNGDDKRNFLENFTTMQEENSEETIMHNLSIVKNDHGLQATIDVNTIWT